MADHNPFGLGDENTRSSDSDSSNIEKTRSQAPSKKLPSSRVGFPKQLEALRVYAHLSERGAKPIHYTQVAEVLGVHESNVSTMNPFFLETGLLTKQSNKHVPCAEVVEFHRAYEWNPDGAANKLAPLIKNTWFGRALTNRLAFRAMNEAEAIEVLAAECSASPDAKAQLRMLIDYCEAAGLVDQQNGTLTANKSAPEPEPEPEKHHTPEKPEPVHESPPKPEADTVVSSAGSKRGGINFQVSVDVDLEEMRDWSPERIQMFFAGVAQVLSAQRDEG